MQLMFLWNYYFLIKHAIFFSQKELNVLYIQLVCSDRCVAAAERSWRERPEHLRTGDQSHLTQSSSILSNYDCGRLHASTEPSHAIFHGDKLY